MNLLMTSLLLSFFSFSGTPSEATVDQALQGLADHPRLLVSGAELGALRTSVANNQDLLKILQLVLDESDQVLEKEPMERIQQGKRLLSVSREVLRRVLYLGTAYHFTDKKVYVQRAVAELRAAAAFSDWNPSHFLDVAEMTTAFALGYDWFYYLLSDEDRGILKNAIMEQGIAPSFAGHDSWVKRNNNWNQVCNGGMLFGALAIAEDEPELAKKVILRSVDGLPYAMRTNQPDGIYVEGPSYWEYGTTYNVLFIAALESALGTDFGLAEYPGFKEGGAFPLYVTGPTGDHFTFSDSGSKRQVYPAVYWFARRWKDDGLAWSENLWMERLLRGENVSTGRFLPLALYWWSGEKAQVPTQALAWHGGGINPLAVFRSSWEKPEASFIAIKGGTPRANHGHMDIGSFVLEADGIRWAVDVMGKGYGELEGMGLGLWNMKQESDRWKIFAYHNNSHNTLTVNEKAQIVGGEAPIIAFSDKQDFPFVVIDMTAVYEDDLAQALRGVAMLPDGSILIQDELTNGHAKSSVRWAMSTPATLEVHEAKEGTLRRDDQTLLLSIDAPLDGSLQTFPEYEWQEWDTPMTHLNQVGFFMNLAPEEKSTCRVLFQPGSQGKKTAMPQLPLSQWGEAAL